MLATQNGRSKPVRISSKRSEKLKSGSVITSCGAGALARGPFVLFYPRLIPMCCLTSTESPETRITFPRLVWPEAMVTEQREEFDRGLMGAAFHGGEVKETLSASPSSPVIAFFLAPGWILTAGLTPTFDSWMGIASSFSTKMLPRPAAELPQELFAGAAACAIFPCLPSERSRTQAWS